MPTSPAKPHAVRLASRDRVHRKITPSDLTGLMTDPQRTRMGGSYVWIIPLAIGLIGLVSYAEFPIVAAAWSAIASSVFWTMLFAIALTVGVCGSIASAVIWWACQQERRDMITYRSAMRQYRSMHGVQGEDKEPRQAA